MAMTDRERQMMADMAAERDHWRRQAKRLERQKAKRMDAANTARTEAADAYATEVATAIRAIIRFNRNVTTDAIAAELERRGIRTPSGLKTWSRMQVHRVMKRVGQW